MDIRDKNEKSGVSAPLVLTTGEIPPKIIQGHSFLTCHPSAKHRQIDPVPEEIYAKMCSRVVYVGVKSIGFLSTT